MSSRDDDLSEAIRLTILSQPSLSGNPSFYPDTGESGETYDAEAMADSNGTVEQGSTRRESLVSQVASVLL